MVCSSLREKISGGFFLAIRSGFPRNGWLSRKILNC
jgi:hypothetical protein